MKRFLILSLLLFMNACTTSGEPSLKLTYPRTGTVVYAEALTIQGTLENASELAVHAELINRETEEVLAQVTSTLDEAWSIELPLNYNGDALQAILRLTSEDETTVYTTSEIIIADQSYRPEGSFGTILFPENETNIGGDSVQIDGTASGIRDNMLTVQFVDSTDEIITSHNVTLINPFIIDEVPWQFEIQLTNLDDLAQIRLVSSDENGEERLLDEVNVQVGTAAG